MSAIPPTIQGWPDWMVPQGPSPNVIVADTHALVAGSVVYGPIDVSSWPITEIGITVTGGTATSVAVKLFFTSVGGASIGGNDVESVLLVGFPGNFGHWSVPNRGGQLTITVSSNPGANTMAYTLNVIERAGVLGAWHPGQINLNSNAALGAGATQTVNSNAVGSGWAVVSVFNAGAASADCAVDLLNTGGGWDTVVAVSAPAAEFMRSFMFYLPPSLSRTRLTNRGAGAANCAAAILLGGP